MPVAPFGAGIGPIGRGSGAGGQALRMRRPVATVGELSTVPYGPTNGYATPNGVTGFIGPAGGSLRVPTTYYVRTGGSNLNGGTSTSLTAARSGTDGTTTSGSRNFSSPTGAFTSADVGQGMRFTTNGPAWFRIVSVTNATTVVLDRAWAFTTVTGTQIWTIGGAWADLAPLGTSVNNAAQVSAPDVIYVGAGTYRTVYSIFATPAFNGQIQILADVTGQFTGDAGMVQFTAYTTNDKTAPSATTLLNLNGKSNMAFSNIMFVGGTAGAVVTATTQTSQNITFTDICILVPPSAASRPFTVTCGFGVPLNWTLDRCYVVAAANGGLVTLVTGVGSDYSANFVMRNTVFHIQASSAPITVSNSGVLANKGGGVFCANTFLNGGGVIISNANVSSVFPSRVTNSIISAAGGIGLQAATLGQLLESNNLIYATTPRTNVNVGAGSISDGSYSPLFHFGQEKIWGALLRRFGEPMAGSPLLGFGNDGTQTPYDLANRQRPANNVASALSAVGALERHDTAAQATNPGFPTTPLLDSLMGPDGPLSSSWTSPVDDDAAGLTIIGKKAVGVFSGGTPSASAWNVSAFGPDMEAYCDIAVTPTGNDGPNVVFLQNLNPTGPATYELGTRFPALDSFLINRHDPGVGTTTLASFSQAYVAGDSIGLSRVGTLLTAWYKPFEGSWRAIGSVNDATYDTTGWRVATEYFGNTGGISNFGGGTRVAPPSGTHVWQFVGPGDQEFLLPVSAVADGFSIYVQRDANYSPGPGQTNPGFTITGLNPIGVAQQTIIDSGHSGQWNLLTAASFTPSAEGWVTVRIFSQDGSGTSVVSFAVATPS